jgi:hypothetical protein
MFETNPNQATGRLGQSNESRPIVLPQGTRGKRKGGMRARFHGVMAGLLAATLILAVCALPQMSADAGSPAERTPFDVPDDRPDDTNDRPDDTNDRPDEAATADISAFPTEEVKAWAKNYGFDLNAFMNPFDPTTIAPHEPTAEDVALFMEWVRSGGNPRNMIMKAVSEAIGESISNQLWNYLNTAFWSGFMNKANVGSVVSKTSGLKNVGAIQEGQFAAYFGSYFSDVIAGAGNYPNDGRNPGGGNPIGSANSGDIGGSGSIGEAANGGGNPTGSANGSDIGGSGSVGEAANNRSEGYRYSAAATLISHGFLVSSDASTWRLHNAADGSVAYSVTAKELSEGMEQGFVAIVDEAGQTYWKAGVESSAELVKLYNITGDCAKAYVMPSNGETHPYMYPDLSWKLTVSGDKPSWYAQSHEDAIMAAFDEWKAYVYDFDLDGLLNFFAKLPSEPVSPTAADIENLKLWAAINNAEASGNSGSGNSGSGNAGNNFNWVGKSSAGDAASYLNDAFSEAHGECPGPIVCHAIEAYLGIELEPAVEDIIGSSVGENALTAGFFANTAKGQSIGAFPYQACYELWQRGFIAGTDGAVWWLVSGKDGEVVYEATENELIGSAPVATPTPSAVIVNGENVAFDAYYINGSNYFKLRDLAYVLNGTAKQFGVAWESAGNIIRLTGGEAYAPDGSEMKSKGAGEKTPAATSSQIYLDGKSVKLAAYNIDGSNYFKLRDIASAFDFAVGWDGADNTVVVDTAAGYAPESQ